VQAGRGEGFVQPFDLCTQVRVSPLRPGEVAGARALFQLRGGLPAGWGTDGCDRTLQPVGRHPERFGITTPERAVDLSLRGGIVRPKQLDDLGKEAPIPSGVRERRALVEDVGDSRFSPGLRLIPRCHPSEALNRRDQLIHIDRFRQVSIHPRRQAPLAIPLHRMSSKGNQG
jgi:hypothetical protein